MNAKTIFDSGPVSLDGNWERTTISMTDRGISVAKDFIKVSDYRVNVALPEPKPSTSYYNEYPKFPADWTATFQDGSTALDIWEQHLAESFDPYATLAGYHPAQDPAAVALGSKTSPAKRFPPPPMAARVAGPA
jgi:hypothetical protein